MPDNHKSVPDVASVTDTTSQPTFTSTTATEQLAQQTAQMVDDIRKLIRFVFFSFSLLLRFCCLVPQ